MLRHSHPDLSLAAHDQAVDADIETLFAGTAEAVNIAKNADWKMNLLLGMTASIVALVIAVFAWLFTQLQTVGDKAVMNAGREARIAVGEQDRRFEERATEIAQRAVRLDREQRAREGLSIVAGH